MTQGPDDDIAETLVEGDSYEQAALSVDRMIPLSLGQKIRLAVGTLALSVAVAPAVLVRRDLARSLEGTASMSLTLGLVVLNGILTTFLGGLFLVRQQYIVRNRSLTDQEAQRLVRVEDFFVLAVVLGGGFIAASVALVAVGVFLPDLVEVLYEYDVNIYSPDDTLGVDIRLISAAGGVLAGVLFGLWRLVE